MWKKNYSANAKVLDSTFASRPQMYSYFKIFAKEHNRFELSVLDYPLGVILRSQFAENKATSKLTRIAKSPTSDGPSSATVEVIELILICRHSEH